LITVPRRKTEKATYGSGHQDKWSYAPSKRPSKAKGKPSEFFALGLGFGRMKGFSVPLEIKLHFKKFLGMLMLAVTLSCFTQPSQELGIVGLTSGLDESFKFRAYATIHNFLP
jgi:hypothetical protein